MKTLQGKNKYSILNLYLKLSSINFNNILLTDFNNILITDFNNIPQEQK